MIDLLTEFSARKYSTSFLSLHQALELQLLHFL